MSANTTPTREKIIDALSRRFRAEVTVKALWLEGADALGEVDRYSDIDICCSVEPEMLGRACQLARETLAGLGTLDLDDLRAAGADYRYASFHLAGTSEYQIVDFNAYVGRGSSFYTGDPIERPMVLFDRTGVVTFRQPDWSSIDARLQEQLPALINTVAQSARIQKYVLRGEFLEAFGYYHKWLLAPLVQALRMRYTPIYTDYYIVHISRHLPSSVLARLEDLFKVSSTAEISQKSRLAREFFEETAAYLSQHQPGADNPTVQEKKT